MHITKYFHSFLYKTPQTLSACTQQIQIPLQQITPLLQKSYAITKESVFLSGCFRNLSSFSEQSLKKLHEHSHTGIKITHNTFSQYDYTTYLEKWLFHFIHDCTECQGNKHIQNFSGYKRPYQPSFTQQILHSCFKRCFQSLC